MKRVNGIANNNYEEVRRESENRQREEGAFRDI